MENNMDVPLKTKNSFILKKTFHLLIMFSVLPNVIERNYKQETIPGIKSEKCKANDILKTDVLTMYLRLLCDWVSHLQITCTWTNSKLNGNHY